MSDRTWNRILMGLWGLFLIAWLWPANWWLEVRRMHVNDGLAGQPITMEVERKIIRPFFGEWSAIVRKRQGAGWVVVCPSVGSTDYRADATLPHDLTLEWWTAGTCPALVAGSYVLTTTWAIYPEFMPKKVLKVVSNEFTIR